MNSIIIVIKQTITSCPPIINLVDVLIDLKFQIHILSGDEICPLSGEKYKDKITFIPLNVNNSTSKIGKIITWLKFRRKVFQFLTSNSALVSRSILWIGSADAALALGKELFKYKYIFQCHELYDAFPLYKNKLGEYMNHASLVVNPSDERGAIFRSWYKLKETPITLPNKTYYHPQKLQLDIDDEDAKNTINKLKGKKILLYQGGIVAQRDVSKIAEAVEKINGDWILVLMGNTDKSNYLMNLLNRYKKIVYIKRLNAPSHLQVTSWARIGIVSYSYDDINHVFCAPNKTYEYTGFGIPMLGNTVPGIANDIKKYKSGEVVDLESCEVDEVIEKLSIIDENYEKYSKGARDFYESVDIVAIIIKIIKSINSKHETC